MSSSEETGSQVLGSWNKEARADSCFYRVREAAVAAVYNCLVRAWSALIRSVLLGMCLGYLGVRLGTCLYSSTTRTAERLSGLALPIHLLLRIRAF